MKTLFKNFIFAFVFASFVAPTVLLAKRRNHPYKYISLYVGVYHDEKIPGAPGKISKSGTFSKYTKINYSSSRKNLRFYPTKPGLVTLFIKSPSSGKILYEFRLEIQKTRLNKVAKEIRELIRGVDGITIKIINSKVIVDGQILLPRDMARIHNVVRQYGDLASSLVTLSPLAQRKIAQLIERDINNPEVTVRAINNKFILEGTVDSSLQRDQAQTIAEAYVPDVIINQAVAEKKVLAKRSKPVINLIIIREAKAAGPKKIIQMVIHYVELQKDYGKSFRFQWTPDLGDGSAVSFSTGSRGAAGVVSSITGTISNLLPKLNWAKEHGHARILQSSSILVEDGQLGNVNSVQKVPYRNITKEGLASTSFEETGIRASITPQIIGDRSDSVKLKMNFSVKALIGITPAGPLTSQREIQSVIVVRSGQSAAVGGLISSEKGTSYNKLPTNVSSNPLFSLYSSKTFRNNKSQFVVFVTPLIKSSASEGSDKIKRKFRLRK